MAGWMVGWMAGWMDGWMTGWLDGWMDGWMDGWLDDWMAGWLDGWMAGWLDGWMVGCTYTICTPTYNPKNVTMGRQTSGKFWETFNLCRESFFPSTDFVK